MMQLCTEATTCRREASWPFSSRATPETQLSDVAVECVSDGSRVGARRLLELQLAAPAVDLVSEMIELSVIDVEIGSR